KRCIGINEQKGDYKSFLGIKKEKFDCKSEDVLMPKEFKNHTFIDENICKRKCFKTQGVLLSCEKF
ncbi:hypothetical protein OAT44_06920, partial [Alphaproteobacteria bacterium]|nr:hypothetical protein [Alphaproteobacteria bacterium]